ncbi:hypothetical protein U1Q18_052302 [Sarracenia purpurea var. burkii]
MSERRMAYAETSQHDFFLAAGTAGGCPRLCGLTNAPEFIDGRKISPMVRHGNEVDPSFAAVSARRFPGIPKCDGTHASTILVVGIIYTTDDFFREWMLKFVTKVLNRVKSVSRVCADQIGKGWPEETISSITSLIAKSSADRTEKEFGSENRRIILFSVAIPHPVPWEFLAPSVYIIR